MKILCAYCNAIMNPGGAPDDQVSYGICDRCTRNVLSDIGIDICKYLDMFDAPVFLVDPDMRLLGGSYKAVRFLGKTLDQVINSRVGDCLQCSNARFPGGCGKAVCCSGCVIMNSVGKTYETGEPADHLPAVLTQVTPDQFREIDLLVSTRKAGPVVILRIEPIGSGNALNPPVF